MCALNPDDNRYIPARQITKIYGIPHRHLHMLVYTYDVRIEPRGKQYSYHEQDVINYIFGIRAPRETCKMRAAKWFRVYFDGGLPEHMREGFLQDCAEALSISRSSAYSGWTIYKGEAHE